LQRVSPAGQEQLPAWQLVPPAQVFPQAPQLTVLVWVSTQMPLQSVSDGPHAQAPETQVLPPVQTWLQAPQFCSSVLVSTHVPLHSVSSRQSAVHRPALHTSRTPCRNRRSWRGR
jgi:hypothetical protein